MSDLEDPVPLGRVFLRKDGPDPIERPFVASLMEEIEQEFDSGLRIDGRRSIGTARERIWAADYEINWFGKHTDTDDYCSVCAFRRGLANWSGGSLSIFDDAFEDLAIAKTDWDRICQKIKARPARPTASALDEWMRQNQPHWLKRDLSIKACHDETGATMREAAAAYGRLPDDMKLGRGEKPPKLGEIEH
jgi:hypothetical protein